MSACTLETHLAPVQVDAGTRPVDALADSLKSPKLEFVEVTHGVGGRPGSCDGSGILVWRLDWPRCNYKIDQIGFSFQAASAYTGATPFPAEPVRVTTGKRDSEVLFRWQDDPPSQQQSLQLRVEVRAVARDNQLGPPCYLDIGASQQD